MIEETPLQLYVSALVFSPRSSEVKKRNRGEMPSWILNEFPGPGDWSSSESSRSLSIAHSSKIYSFAISPDSTLVATACGDRMIHIWDVMNGIERFRLEGNPDGVASVCFSPNMCLVASSAENLVSIWNIQAALGARHQPEFQLCFTRQGVDPKSSNHPMCAISSSGNVLTAVDYPNDIWVWDMAAKQSPKYHFQVESPRKIIGVYFSSDGSLLIAITVLSDWPWWGEKGEIVDAWHISTGIKVSTEKSAPEGPFLGILSGTRYMTVPPIQFSNRRRLTLRDARTGLNERKSHIPGFAKLGDWTPSKALCRPGDGKFLLASRMGPSIILGMLGDKNVTLLEIETDVERFNVSPDGKHIVSNNSSNEVRVRNIEGIFSKSPLPMKMHRCLQNVGSQWGRLMRRILNTNQFTSGDLGPFGWTICADGSLLATDGNRNSPIIIWDTKRGEEKFCLNLPKTRRRMAKFSASGNVVGVLDSSSIHLWETETGKKRDILKIDSLYKAKHGFLTISEKGGKVIYIGQGPSISKCYCWEFDGLRKISGFEIPIRSHREVRIELSANEESYCLWNRESAILEVSRFPSNTIRHTVLPGIAKQVTFMPDSQHIWVLYEAEGGRRQGIRIWNIEQDIFREVHVDLLPDFTNESCADDDGGLDRTPNEDQPKLYGPDYYAGITSRDGELLALVGYCQGVPMVDVFQTSNLKAVFRAKHGSSNGFIKFDPSGTHLITNQGGFPLPGASPPRPLLYATPCWIQEDGEDILAITPQYRYAIEVIHGHTITFSDSDDLPVSLRLDEGMKTMIS